MPATRRGTRFGPRLIWPWSGGAGGSESGVPLPDVASGEPTPLARMIKAEALERLLDCVSTLKEPSHKIFVLRMIERQPYEVIAKKFGKTAHQCAAMLRGGAGVARETGGRKRRIGNPKYRRQP